MCFDFTTLSKAWPKDSYPLPKIDSFDCTVGHELLNFMDAFSGYHQIPLAKKYQEKMALIVNIGMYYYNVMLFRLENAKAICKWLVNKVIATLMRKAMEAYVDDMIAKSLKEIDHVKDLEETVKILRH